MQYYFSYLINKMIRKLKKTPQSVFTDSRDRIWMTSSFGEFGGSVQIFDMQKKEPLNVKFNINMGLLFPKSVFNDDEGNIYITSGLQHFMNSGAIYKVDHNDSVTKIYDSEDYRDTTKRQLYAGIFVGPGAFNKTNSSLYFATTQGFYKAAVPVSGKLQDPQVIFNPSLHWGNEPLAIGVSMAVKKMEFIQSGKLLFMTSYDGFGIFDNHQLIFLK